MKQNQKFSVLFWLHSQKKRNNKLALYIRVTVDNKRTAIATTHFIEPKHWDKKQARVRSTSPDSNLINAYIMRSINSIQQEFLDKQARGLVTSAKELKSAFLGIEVAINQKTICEAFDFHNLKMEEKVNVDLISPKTHKRYIQNRRQSTYRNAFILCNRI
jgi:hypothetical protein